MQEPAPSLPAEGQASQATQTPAKAPEAPQAEPKRSLQDLLREPEASPAPEGAQPAPAPERASKAEPPKGLSDLAERLGVKPESLYGLQIPIANGESITLGKLKDAATAAGDLTERELRIEENRVKREGELLRAQQELQELIAALPPQALKPEALERVRGAREATMAREREHTLNAIPEWRDEEKRTAEIAGMVEHLKGYGFPANYLQSVTDHRAIRYVRENWLRQQRIERALAQVEKAPPAPTAKSKPNGAAPKAPTPRGGSQDPRARLMALLNN